MSDHTPGPWGDKNKIIYIRGATWVGQVNWDDEEAKANARLMSASPDMFDALRSFVAHYPMGLNPFLDTAYRNAREAIAKAKGAE